MKISLYLSIVISVVFFLLEISTCYSQIHFEKSRIVIKQNQKHPDSTINEIFFFKNNTESDVLIAEVRTSCTCTTPGYSYDLIKKGQKGYVMLSTTTRQLMNSRKVDGVVKITNQKGEKFFYKIELRYD